MTGSAVGSGAEPGKIKHFFKKFHTYIHLRNPKSTNKFINGMGPSNQ